MRRSGDVRSFVGYCRTSNIGSALSGKRCQVLASFSSKRQICPRADCRTSSPLSMCQEVGPKRVTSTSQPGLSFSARLSEPAAAAVLASESVQIGLPVLREIDRSEEHTSELQSPVHLV